MPPFFILPTLSFSLSLSLSLLRRPRIRHRCRRRLRPFDGGDGHGDATGITFVIGVNERDE